MMKKFLKAGNTVIFSIIILPVHLLSQDLSISFQDGVDGYDGTIDTYIDNKNPNSSFGNSSGILWDRSPDEYTTFIRFDNIFASEGGSLPDNSFIVSAFLTYYVFNPGDDAAVSEVLIPWDAGLTWNQFDFNNDIGIFVGTAESGSVNTFESIDVTTSLFAWSANPSLNNGWIFQFTGDDGSDVYSSEWTTLNQRPKLTVVYSDNFPPDQPAVISPADNSTEVTLSPSLTVHVTDPEQDTLEVRYFIRAISSFVESNFTIIGIPDTQHYTDNINNNQYFYDQTNWIVTNKDALNIVFISQLGDCVQNGNSFDSEWQVANTAWTIVENPVTTGLIDGIPYGVNVGNHDQSPNGGGSEASTSKFNQYFGVSRFQGRGYYGDHYGSDNDNHFELFSVGGLYFIIINFEYDTTPDQDVLNWADALLKTFSNRRAIVATHYLIETDESASPNAFGAQGQQVYDNLKNNSNLFLMLCGHNHGEGKRSDVFNGNTITTLLADYQEYPNGGNGFLRILDFRPGENKVYVSTYSPSLNQFERDSNSEFDFDYDMGSSVFQEIGNLTNVMSGTDAGLTVSSLSTETKYEWYVQVFDGLSTITSPTWTFTTEAEDPSLPIFLSSFTATWTEPGINLEWIVESETENIGFIIEKSEESENGPFVEIASYKMMESLKGRGNASNRKNYSYFDKDILRDRTYSFRLADVSTNGMVTYHDAISIHTEGKLLDFRLQQNYPNPFNPSTVIKFTLPKTENVIIEIYNTLGQKVEILLNEQLQAGNHEIEFNAQDLSSGIFYYRIEVGKYQDVKKMILLR